MARRAAHYATPTKRDLSERQREVLALIAAGKTNGEIAERLGISLDGAKWHVSEILTKLGVSTREEAAEWWQAQCGVRSRVASWARVFAPLANWKVGVGAGTVVTAGVLGFIFLDGDRHTPEHPTPDCIASDLILETVEARGDAGAVVLALTGRSRGEGECRFSGNAEFLPVSRTTPQAVGFFPEPGTVAVEPILSTTSRVIATSQWRQSCLGPDFDVMAALTKRGVDVAFAVAPPLFVVNRPPCPGGNPLNPGRFEVDAVASRTLLLEPSPEGRVFCFADPKWGKQCTQVDRLQSALQGTNGLGRLADPFIQFAAPREYTCPVPGYDGTTICQGAADGETRSGIPVAFHGSEGDILSVAQLRERLGEWMNNGPTRVATIGCPTSTSDCDAKFAIGFAVDAQPAAFYLVFESRGDTVALVAAGVSGDNALEIRRGGTTMTSALGETLFTSVIPPY